MSRRLDPSAWWQRIASRVGAVPAAAVAADATSDDAETQTRDAAVKFFDRHRVAVPHVAAKTKRWLHGLHIQQ